MKNTALKLQVFDKSSAQSYLEQDEFIQEWQLLYKNCPWATGYQSVEYVTTWYHLFIKKFSPLLLVSYDEKSKINGLFALAKSLETEEIVVAGNLHPEYRVWLTTPENNQAFLIEILLWLKNNCSHVLELSYLPHDIKLDALSRYTSLAWHCIIGTQPNHWLRINNDEAWVAEYMRSKKRLKSKLNKLKRMGKLEFKRVTEALELDALLAQIIPLYEFRQGAIHQSMPFHINPLKREFTVKLLQKKRLHASVLMLDGEVLAALLCVHGHGKVHLGEIAYSAFHSDVSPGLIHLWLLVESLARDGFQVLDLTPGGDSYKDRFANDQVEVQEFKFYPKLSSALVIKFKQTLKRILKKIISAFFKKENKKSVNLEFVNYKKIKFETRVDNDEIQKLSVCTKNKVIDLLCFEGGKNNTNKEKYFEFLKSSFELISLGASLYTLVENDVLVYAIWVIVDVQKNHLKFLPSGIVLNDSCVLKIYPNKNLNLNTYQQAIQNIKQILPKNNLIYLLEEK